MYLKSPQPKLLKYWAPPVAWMVVIFLFSSIHTRPVSTVYWREFAVKKSAHIVEYAILTVLLYRAFRTSYSKQKAGIYAMVISVIYAITDEFHQSFTPGREPTVRDVIFDTIGATLAIFLTWNYLPKAPKRLKNWAKKLELI